jgi:hypothetical protein
MAKKFSFACLLFLSANILNSSFPTPLGRDRLRSSSFDVVGVRPKAMRSLVPISSDNDSPSRPSSVYISINDTGAEHSHSGVAVTVGRADSSVWRRHLTKKNFDRFVRYTLVACVGVTIGLTLKTCADMQTACGQAQGELGECKGLIKEVSRLAALVCKLDPSLCDTANNLIKE